MRGRSPFNRPDIRKREVFRLLKDLGGRARWSQVKQKAREVRMGPTTLKRLLDEMEEEGTIYVEVKRGRRGPEVWYVIQMTKEGIWKKLDENPVRRMVKGLAERLGVLQEDHDAETALLKEKLPSLIAGYLLLHFYAILMAAKEEPLDKAAREWAYIYYTFLVEEGAALIGLLTTFPEASLKALEHAQDLIEEALMSLLLEPEGEE